MAMHHHVLPTCCMMSMSYMVETISLVFPIGMVCTIDMISMSYMVETISLVVPIGMVCTIDLIHWCCTLHVVYILDILRWLLS